MNINEWCGGEKTICESWKIVTFGVPRIGSRTGLQKIRMSHANRDTWQSQEQLNRRSQDFYCEGMKNSWYLHSDAKVSSEEKSIFPKLLLNNQIYIGNPRKRWVAPLPRNKWQNIFIIQTYMHILDLKERHSSRKTRSFSILLPPLTPKKSCVQCWFSCIV